MSYFDLNTRLTWEDSAVRDSAHQFAREIMRPIAKKLDRMSAAEVIAEGSPLYEFLRQAYQLGFHKAAFPESLGGAGLTPMQQAIANEELGWGSFGLAVLLGVQTFPFHFLLATGNQEMIERYVIPFINCTDGSIRACWGISEPNHGSDNVGFGERFFHDAKIRSDLRGRLDGNEWVITGQKSAWVSGATLATHALLHVQIDPSLGLSGTGIAFTPLDIAGVTKGAPLEKLGQRDLNQGELFFDDVRIPASHMLLGPEQYETALFNILAYANMAMGICATGLARATYEESLAWCRDRVQGGVPLIEHYGIRQRLFRMFSRVETCRALARTVFEKNADNPRPVTEYSIASKVMCTELCYKNADDAIQLHGGCGLTHEYPAEKLFRDARAALIEDGNNEALEAKGGRFLVDLYPRVQEIV